ncbi:MAG: hypothetical protein DCC69_14085 [Hyphomicrobiales bacterium]|nr:MAG: hypothetical protein DCC69_14085 [Hyphomicrobiales bacterium]
MMNAGKFRAAGAVAVALALAGCQGIGGPPRSGGPIASAPPPSSGFNGDWMSTDGVAISRFNNGYFETLATDTGNKLAEGSYTQTGPTSVTISVTSLIRQTTTQVNCAMVTQTQLNCTSSAGSQFSLVRRAGGIS